MEKITLCKCGYEPTRYRFVKGVGWWYYFGCIGCDVYGGDAATEEKALKNWNVRIATEGGK